MPDMTESIYFCVEWNDNIPVTLMHVDVVDMQDMLSGLTNLVASV